MSYERNPTPYRIDGEKVMARQDSGGVLAEVTIDGKLYQSLCNDAGDTLGAAVEMLFLRVRNYRPLAIFAATVDAMPDNLRTLLRDPPGEKTNRIARMHALDNAVAYWSDNGETGILNITYGPGACDGEHTAHVVGNGTLQAPLAVKLTPKQACANELWDACRAIKAAAESRDPDLAKRGVDEALAAVDLALLKVLQVATDRERETGGAT